MSENQNTEHLQNEIDQNSKSFNQPSYSSKEIQCQISNDVLRNTIQIENKDQKPKASVENSNINQNENNEKGNISNNETKNISCGSNVNIEESSDFNKNTNNTDDNTTNIIIEEEEEYESENDESDNGGGDDDDDSQDISDDDKDYDSDDINDEESYSDEPDESENEEYTYTPENSNEKNDETYSNSNNEEEYYSDYYSDENEDKRSDNLNKKPSKNSNHHHHHRHHKHHAGKSLNKSGSNSNKYKHHKKKRRRCTSDQRVNPKTEEGRKAIAHQTLKIIKNGKYTFRRKDNIIEEINISKQISNCVEHTKTYKPNYYYNKKPRNPTARKKKKFCQIEIDSESTFGVAKRLVKKEKIAKTCVLNFASATKPGGGFKNGRTAQEESLARQSALYQSLKTHREMYKYNLKHCSDDSFYNDYMIYSSRVPVFRSDVSERLFSKSEVFETSVITSAAPNLHDVSKYQQERKHYKTIFYERCRKILLLAIEKHNNAIVLGAYGCGVFENDPKFVSSVFKKLLIKGKNGDEPLGYYFTKVVFAITSSKSENFQVFSKRFKDYINPKKK